MLTNKVNRDGYDKAKSFTLYAEITLSEFIKAADPHEYLSGYNKFNITPECRELLKNVKLPKDIDTMCEDLKICGRKEFSDLLKLRHRYIADIENRNKEEKQKLKEERLKNAPAKT